ncbi:MAG: D-alanine--D-alanine ligase [Psychrosphaera sp.]|nr:D-alanine--D-alanine ligase [Psychrosphaera sp.]
MSEFGKVAVILGGTSAERAVSLNSGANVLAGLLDGGVDAFAFDTKDQPLSTLADMNVDRVFIVLHGRGGEDGTIQGALEFMGIPYTGSGVLGSALAMDKIRCKQLFKANDLPTPDFMVVNKADYEKGSTPAIIKNLGGVVFVKPANEGSSIGMDRAQTSEQLSVAIETAMRFDDAVLIESFVDGPEYTVAILAGQALPVIELKTPRTFYDYKAKYHSENTQYICPCALDADKTVQIQKLAKSAFEVVGAKGWGRVDVMLDRKGEFQLLEVNTVPGMTAKSLVPMAAKAAGYELSSLLLEILKTTLDKTV